MSTHARYNVSCLTHTTLVGVRLQFSYSLTSFEIASLPNVAEMYIGNQQRRQQSERNIFLMLYQTE